MITLCLRCVFLWLVCEIPIVAFSQLYSGNAAEIKFTSKAELELIKASSQKGQGVLDIANRKFAFLVNITSFQGFNSELQRKHFNESYMESDKFPTAKFSGKIIEDIDLTKPGVYDVRAKGELDVHGVKQVRIIKGKLTVKSNEIRIEAVFTVPLTDHNITIPKL